mmetsp:Transcript_2619/g.5891  ORF Transcript_2619/g.5891 Transcript_2619/m.5891 type:complete len:227 (+) Transcript_2619:606-1286(+)
MFLGFPRPEKRRPCRRASLGRTGALHLCERSAEVHDCLRSTSIPACVSVGGGRWPGENYPLTHRMGNEGTCKRICSYGCRRSAGAAHVCPSPSSQRRGGRPRCVQLHRVRRLNRSRGVRRGAPRPDSGHHLRPGDPGCAWAAYSDGFSCGYPSRAAGYRCPTGYARAGAVVQRMQGTSQTNLRVVWSARVQGYGDATQGAWHGPRRASSFRPRGLHRSPSYPHSSR